MANRFFLLINNKIIKYVLAILLSAVMIFNVLFLTACGDDNSSDNNGQTDNRTNEQVNTDDGLYYDGKFMCGVCHPPYGSEEENAAVDLLTEANIGWTRFDISWAPYQKDENGNVPLDEDGNVIYNSSYKNFRERCTFYASKGIRVMAVTPYPKVFFPEEYANNVDITEFSEEDIALMQEYAAFFASDLKGIVQAIQITNEMGQSNFIRPLANQKLAAQYIGIFAETMHPITSQNGITLGYNLDAMAMFTLPNLMKPYNKFIDWVGIDIYLGSFEETFHDIDYTFEMLDYVYGQTKKPIILCEFGYINKGAAKTEEERIAVLQSYGYNSEDEVKDDIEGFINAFEAANGYSTLVKEARARLYDDDGNIVGEEDAFHYLFETDKVSHIYCELQSGRYLVGYPHTKQGHADFFNYIIPKLYEKEYLIGMFIYCFAEDNDCYICGQEDCPIETAWGIVTADFEPNLSYYAVQTQFGNIMEAEANK